MKKIILLLLLANIITQFLLAQNGNVGIGTSTPLARLHVADSSVVFTASDILPFTPGNPPVSGPGTRLMWYPDKAAFRVGIVGPDDIFGDGNDFWDKGKIGYFSFACGYNTLAGYGSLATGYHTNAGEFSTALGYVTRATGGWSTAMGYQTRATGNYSTAMGWGNTASGDFASTSIGFGTWAFGAASVAMGHKSKAAGTRSTAMGDSTVAKAYASTSMGSFNDSISTSNPTAWVPTDPLLYVGNGTSNATRSNAVVVYKNGNTDLNGYTQLGKTSEAAPSIKMKKLTSVSYSSQNNWVNVPHGLSQSKILAVNIIMNVPGFVNVPPGYTYHSGYEYQYQVASANIVVINSNGNSANILSKSFTILITYEE